MMAEVFESGGGERAEGGESLEGDRGIGGGVVVGEVEAKLSVEGVAGADGEVTMVG